MRIGSRRGKTGWSEILNLKFQTLIFRLRSKPLIHFEFRILDLEFQLGAAAVGFAEGMEEGVHAAFLDLADMSHEFAEAAFWE